MSGGKATPLHTHPDSDETAVVLEGEILMHVDGADHHLGAGAVAVAPRGVPHPTTESADGKSSGPRRRP